MILTLSPLDIVNKSNPNSLLIKVTTSFINSILIKLLLAILLLISLIKNDFLFKLKKSDNFDNSEI
jgi:hypothetical protein